MERGEILSSGVFLSDELAHFFVDLRGKVHQFFQVIDIDVDGVADFQSDVSFFCFHDFDSHRFAPFQFRYKYLEVMP